MIHGRGVVGQALRLPFIGRGKRCACPTILWLATAIFVYGGNDTPNVAVAQQQAPTWSKDDLNFFLHGSMSTEIVPESDTAGSGNSNSGHDYGTNLSDNDKHDLIEYLKTL